MRIKEKPGTPWPSRHLGVVLLVCGGVFIGDFFWRIATYSPSITAAPLSVQAVLAAGTLAGAVLVGVGVAAILHSAGHLDLVAAADWEL